MKKILIATALIAAPLASDAAMNKASGDKFSGFSMGVRFAGGYEMKEEKLIENAGSKTGAHVFEGNKSWGMSGVSLGYGKVFSGFYLGLMGNVLSQFGMEDYTVPAPKNKPVSLKPESLENGKTKIARYKFAGDVRARFGVPVTENLLGSVDVGVGYNPIDLVSDEKGLKDASSDFSNSLYIPVALNVDHALTHNLQVGGFVEGVFRNFTSLEKKFSDIDSLKDKGTGDDAAKKAWNDSTVKFKLPITVNYGVKLTYRF